MLRKSHEQGFSQEVQAWDRLQTCQSAEDGLVLLFVSYSLNEWVGLVHKTGCVTEARDGMNIDLHTRGNKARQLTIVPFGGT